MWFAQTLALRFGLPDFWAILDWPESLLNYWQARYLMEPWDAENRLALLKMKHEPPTWLTRKGRWMNGREILSRLQGKR